jgi:hypothetical protein
MVSIHVCIYMYIRMYIRMYMLYILTNQSIYSIVNENEYTKRQYQLFISI